MALIIGIEKNSRVQIGPDVLTVVDVLGVASIAVRLNNGPTLTLTADVKTELVPSVVAYCGVNANETISKRGLPSKLLKTFASND